jgi:hypothetical protein
MADQDSPTETETKTSSALESLLRKYGGREAVHATFDRLSSVAGTESKSRISSAPKIAIEPLSTGDVSAQVAAIELDLAALAEEYGQLNVNFSNIVSHKGIKLNANDLAKIALYYVTGRTESRRKVKIEAARRNGNAIEILTDKMGNVLNTQHQKGIEGRDYAKAVQIENITHMKKLDRSLIDRLRRGYVSGADLSQAQEEVKKIEKELSDIDEILTNYENDVQKAKATGDLATVTKLTDEMGQVLDIKEGVRDGALAAGGVVSDIRRKMLESAEGVQSAKGAYAASKVNDVAINLWIDAMTELEFKYRHALEDMIPVFKIQGKIAAGGKAALEMKQALVRTAEISNRLMHINSSLVQKLTSEVFELVKTPLYDAAKAKELEVRLKGYMDQLNANKKEWAETQQRVSEIPTAPHYAQHT